MNTSKNILIITRNLPPLVGGMERLNWHIADELSQQNQVTLISHSAAKKLAPSKNTKFYTAPLNPLPLFLIISFIRAFWICITQPTDTLFAGSGLTAPIVVILAKIFRKKSIVYIHGLDIGTNNKVYNLCWIPFIRQADQVIANSSPTLQLCIRKNIPTNKLSIIHPGVTYPPEPRNESLIASIKEQYNIQNKKILISVGRLTQRKGMNEFVNQCLPKIIKEEPLTCLVIIGDTPINALNKNIQSKEEILETAAKLGIENHILFVGNITNDEILSCWYYLANLHVFPVKHIPDDPEGFGMVAIEAAAHGLPTVAFATGGIIDAVKDGTSGYLVKKNDYCDFSQKTVLSLNDPMKFRDIKAFAEKFSWKKFGEQISNELKSTTLQTTDLKNLPRRQAHAVTNLVSRIPKAKKIEVLLNIQNLPHGKPIRILEVGCGSGGIAHYFATHKELLCEVTAVDVHDNRQVFDNYHFIKIEDTKLPFANNSFDLVITNHVIEHVGTLYDQRLHLKEIHRVLSPQGLCYLAAPNRWMVTEPHYNLKFLSWLPRKLRTRYLRWAGKGEYYDCEPPSLKELECLLTDADFLFKNISVPATRVLFELENPDSLINIILKKLPDSALNFFKAIIPTLIYRLEIKK